jgi:hypothetical protein
MIRSLASVLITVALIMPLRGSVIGGEMNKELRNFILYVLIGFPTVLIGGILVATLVMAFANFITMMR